MSLPIAARRPTTAGPDLVLLPRFSRLGASSRYRFFQFLGDLQAAGWRVVVRPLFSDAYLRHRYAGGGWPAGAMARCYLDRWRYLRRLPPGTPLLIEKELFPWVPPGVEGMLLRGHPYVLDFDDDVHAWYGRLPMLGTKFSAMAGQAAGLQAGNAVLADRCRRFNPRTRLFPTVLEPDEYAPRGEEPPGRVLRLGWIGSPLSRLHLEALLPVLDTLPEGRFELHAMGTGPLAGGRLPLTTHPWSPAAEKRFLRTIDAGLMPLAPGPFSEGKCGFKLLQYLAAGVPAVAADSRANRDILDDGRAGLLVATATDWAPALTRLHQDPALWRRLAAAGHRRVRREFAARDWAPRLVDWLREALALPGPLSTPSRTG
ncbi:MAG: glycosyltransferase family 4 protein [Candidatus Riflebacteria bacterium]|nr:glycosyltransferase family 4 protein [Candidatus Riflebacteria bacterium]